MLGEASSESDCCSVDGSSHSSDQQLRTCQTSAVVLSGRQPSVLFCGSALPVQWVNNLIPIKVATEDVYMADGLWKRL
jgi:hypothetical protein